MKNPTSVKLRWSKKASSDEGGESTFSTNWHIQWIKGERIIENTNPIFCIFAVKHLI
jgi:hypothetical protein